MLRFKISPFRWRKRFHSVFMKSFHKVSYVEHWITSLSHQFFPIIFPATRTSMRPSDFCENKPWVPQYRKYSKYVSNCLSIRIESTWTEVVKCLSWSCRKFLHRNCWLRGQITLMSFPASALFLHGVLDSQYAIHFVYNNSMCVCSFCTVCNYVHCVYGAVSHV